MVKPHDILGMNARQKLYVRYNPKSARKYAYSKLAPKKIFEKNEIPAPKVYAVFSAMNEVTELAWESIKSPFVIKPAGGSAGNGILIIKKPGKYAGDWISIEGERLSTADLRLHVANILEGQYSTYGTKHVAFVEERVMVHPKLKRYAYKGTPDVRIIIYNRVPVMAMLRLPSRESNGRANLHQGAVGVGIDIATGITLRGVWHGKAIRYLPGVKGKKKRKLNGIRLPKWRTLLTTAVRAAEVTGFKYVGVDLFMHPEKGAMVVELNSNPGLTIQLANNTGLRKRLERVEGLQIRNIKHGVRVGQALFAEWFSDEVKAEDGLIVIDSFEKVKVRSVNKHWDEVEAKVDTGAFRTAIDKNLAEHLGLLNAENILWEGRFRNSFGRQKRPVIDLTLKVKGKKIKTTASVVNRERLKVKLLLGRRDMEGFLVNPQLRRE